MKAQRGYGDGVAQLSFPLPNLLDITQAVTYV